LYGAEEWVGKEKRQNSLHFIKINKVLDISFRYNVNQVC
jgi:hypothetical protein